MESRRRGKCWKNAPLLIAASATTALAESRAMPVPSGAASSRRPASRRAVRPGSAGRAIRGVTGSPSGRPSSGPTPGTTRRGPPTRPGSRRRARDRSGTGGGRSRGPWPLGGHRSRRGTGSKRPQVRRVGTAGGAVARRSCPGSVKLRQTAANTARRASSRATDRASARACRVVGLRRRRYRCASGTMVRRAPGPRRARAGRWPCPAPRTRRRCSPPARTDPSPAGRRGRRGSRRGRSGTTGPPGSARGQGRRSRPSRASRRRRCGGSGRAPARRRRSPRRNRGWCGGGPPKVRSPGRARRRRRSSSGSARWRLPPSREDDRPVSVILPSAFHGVRGSAEVAGIEPTGRGSPVPLVLKTRGATRTRSPPGPVYHLSQRAVGPWGDGRRGRPGLARGVRPTRRAPRSATARAGRCRPGPRRGSRGRWG